MKKNTYVLYMIILLLVCLLTMLVLGTKSQYEYLSQTTIENSLETGNAVYTDLTLAKAGAADSYIDNYFSTKLNNARQALQEKRSAFTAQGVFLQKIDQDRENNCAVPLDLGYDETYSTLALENLDCLERDGYNSDVINYKNTYKTGSDAELRSMVDTNSYFQ